MMNLLLFLLAYLLLLPMTIINYIVVCRVKDTTHKGYFRSTAVNIDRFANREFRASWNKFLRTPYGYPFGNEKETISSALGKNQRGGTLTKTGRRLCWLLDKLDKGHCQKSIEENI